MTYHSMPPFQYAVEHYGIPAEYGRRVVINGEPGVIVECRGHHIGVNFDKDKPGYVVPCHPVWRAEYQGIGKVRKPTRSQQRYRRWLEYGDGFENFRHFLLWDSKPERSWNRGRP